jgi:replication factor C subunit 1
VLSGIFESISRERLEPFLIELGGRVTSAVSGKTDYLIIGHKLEDGREVTTGSKYRKAQEKKTPILDESQLETFLKRQLDNQYFTLENYKEWQDPLKCKQKLNSSEEQKATVAEDDKSAEVKNKSVHAKGTLLTDKYKPVKQSDLIGNKSNIDSLAEWLKDWDDVHIKGNKKQVKPTRGNWSNAPRLNAKAALISGPPGIGKTSTARIISANLGFEVLEMNASDTRNKKTIEHMVGDLSTNYSLDYYSKNNVVRKENKFTNHKKSVIIMDEVDGCGGGDRGGISALIQVIKLSKTPIICICNDRDNRKLMSLINNCFEVKFSRPTVSQISSRIRQIANTEGLTIDDKAIELLINQSGNDIRQIIIQIQVMLTTSNSLSFLELKSRMGLISKDQKLMINNFQAANKLMDYEEFKEMSYRDRLDMFFIDYDFVPLLVQENYLGAMDRTFRGGANDVARMASAANYIAIGDIVNKRVRSQMEWTLLPDCGFTSSIAPCHYAKGQSSYPRFPEWLGKNSSGIKAKRLIKELKQTMGHRVQCNSMTLLNDYLPLIFDEIFKRLVKDDVDEAIEVMDELNISNDQFKEHLVTLIYDKKRVAQLDKISTKSKSAFTRAYNATHKTSLKPKKKKREGAGDVEKDQFDPDKEEPGQLESSDEFSDYTEYEVEEIKKAAKGGKAKKATGGKAKPKTKSKK